MLADADLPESPAWWMKTLYAELAAKRRRLEALDLYARGTPPLVAGSTAQRSAFYSFQQMARANFADLIVQALVERQSVRSIRTAAADDDDGDAAAWAMFTANNLHNGLTDVLRMMATFGDAYVAVGTPDEETSQPVITAEDPRQMITASDPVNPRRTTAAFKLFRDERAGRDLAYLWLRGSPTEPGRLIVAGRTVGTSVSLLRTPPHRLLDGPPPPAQPEFSTSSYTFDDSLGATYDLRAVPVVRFANRGGVGEFETHTDLLDRINHMILQRIVIATLQAFKQRAIELSDLASNDPNDPRALPTHDEAGREIDYDDLFAADPGALWRLPVGAKIWESGQVDLTGILSGVKDDALHLAVVTRTPFSMFTPDAANQSAEGAQLQREGLVFKVEDRNRLAGTSLAQVISLGFSMLGDATRARLGDIIVDWAPAERYSLAERAQADSLAVSLPTAQRLRLIWQLTPAEVQIALAQRASDAMFGPPAPPSSTPPSSGTTGGAG